MCTCVAITCNYTYPTTTCARTRVVLLFYHPLLSSFCSAHHQVSFDQVPSLVRYYSNMHPSDRKMSIILCERARVYIRSMIRVRAFVCLTLKSCAFVCVRVYKEVCVCARACLYKVCVCVRAYISVCACVRACVCEREREKSHQTGSTPTIPHPSTHTKCRTWGSGRAGKDDQTKRTSSDHRIKEKCEKQFQQLSQDMNVTAMTRS